MTANLVASLGLVGGVAIFITWLVNYVMPVLFGFVALFGCIWLVTYIFTSDTKYSAAICRKMFFLSFTIVLRLICFSLIFVWLISELWGVIQKRQVIYLLYVFSPVIFGILFQMYANEKLHRSESRSSLSGTVLRVCLALFAIINVFAIGSMGLSAMTSVTQALHSFVRNTFLYSIPETASLYPYRGILDVCAFFLIGSLVLITVAWTFYGVPLIRHKMYKQEFVGRLINKTRTQLDESNGNSLADSFIFGEVDSDCDARRVLAISLTVFDCSLLNTTMAMYLLPLLGLT